MKLLRVGICFKFRIFYDSVKTSTYLDQFQYLMLPEGDDNDHYSVMTLHKLSGIMVQLDPECIAYFDNVYTSEIRLNMFTRFTCP